MSRLSFSLIAAIFLVLSTSVAAGVAHQLHQISIRRVEAHPQPRYLVLLILDGAMPAYFRLGSLPHLDALRTQGIDYDRAWTSILESETPTGHAAISTGSTPAHDGLLGFNWVTSDDNVVHLFDPNVVRQGVMEHLMQQAGATTIAQLYKEKYPTARVAAVSGHKYYAADPLGGPNADYIMYYAPGPNNTYAPAAIPGHVPPASVLNGSPVVPNKTLAPGQEDDLATDLALSSFQRVQPRLMMINYPEFDWPQGHVDGANLTKAQVLMQKFDADLGRIEDAYRKAGVLDQTVFVVTADHGMIPLTAQVPDKVMDDAVTQAGTTSVETTYSSAGYIWLQNPAVASTVAANIVKAADPHVQSVYYKVTQNGQDRYVRSAGPAIPSGVDAANQYMMGSFLNGNAPDVVVFCTEGTAFVNSGAPSWKGNHGGGSWESQHMPLIISGPGIASGAVSHAPARLIDLAPTILTDLGVTPRGMQGSVLADALASPSPTAVRAQQSLDNQLTPLVDALSQESTKELTPPASH